MNINRKLNHTSANSGMKSSKLAKNSINRNDKCTITPKEFNECKKCKERETNFENLDDLNDNNIMANYVKAINYINSCHDIINGITKKMYSNSVSAISQINMPDVPNFLSLYTLLLPQHGQNSEQKETLPKEKSQTINVSKNVSHMNVDANKQYVEKFTKSPINAIEEIYAKQMCNLAEKRFLEQQGKDPQSVEPIAMIMDEVCNLADISSQHSIKTPKPEKKNCSRKKSQKRKETAYESDDTDTECTIKNYESNNRNLNKQKEVAFEYNLQKASDNLRSTEITPQEDENLLQYNIISKLENAEIEKNSLNQEDVSKFSEDNDNSNQSSPRNG